MNNLTDAIKEITGKYMVMQQKSIEAGDHLLKPDEHVATFWIERSNEVVWYLGIVNEIENNEVSIIHLKRTDRNGQHWYVPGKAEIWKVDEEQIIAQNLSVIYHGTMFNRIELSKATTKEICDSVEEIKHCLQYLIYLPIQYMF